MRILITGGAGFIGSHIAEKLVNEGNDAIVLDDFSEGKAENLKNVKNKIKIIKGDIRNLALLKKEFKDVDFVIHLAALRSVFRSIKEPQLYSDVNITGTENVLKAALYCNVKKVVFASSSSVYGNQKELPLHEKMEAKPISPYAETKLRGEQLCREFYKNYEKHGLETVSLRYFNVFGPRQDPDSEYSAVIPRFITSMLQDKSPTIYGDGEQTRDFSFVEDVADATLLALKLKNRGDVINIGNNEGVSINELFKKIKNLLGKKFEARYNAPREGDIKHTLADISKAKRILNWKPGIGFDEGLKRTAEWFKNKRE